MVRPMVRVAATLILVLAVLRELPPASLHAQNGPLDTPGGMVRFYFHALGSGQCDLAFKFAGQSSRSLGAFRRDCRTIRRITIEQLNDPSYRLHPQTATYTCLAVRYTVYRRSGTATFGGWYLMERTIGSAWRFLVAGSHIARDGSAIHLTKAQCASHLPSYVRPGSGTIVSGSGFLSAAYGWIALSTSGSYLPNGSCTHGIGSNCESTLTTVFRTDDTGRHWISLLHVTTTTSAPPVWIRVFNRQVALVAATVGPLTPAANEHFTSALFSTHDGGRHWLRFPLPVNYATEPGTISFPDPQHGWLWYGGGAGGSMAVEVYRTTDGGRHWSRVACTSWSNPGPGFGCPRQSGIGLGGDKTYLTFKDAHDGWLEAQENTGVPDIYHTADGGASWRRQVVGLPPGVVPPSGKIGQSTVFPSGTLLKPSFVGQIGLLPEEVGFYRPKPRATWDRLYVFRSTDGGRTWQSALRTPVTAPISQWQALDSRHWVFISTTLTGFRQTIWSTENGGVSWTEHAIQLPPGLTLVAVEMVNERDGWGIAQTHADSEVSASGTALLHTTDGGRHWTRQVLP